MGIEEIKARLSNLDAGKVVKYDHAMNLATQYMVDYRNDVTYLLSIIEIAEKHLINIAKLDVEHGKDIKFTMMLSNIVGQALEAIRGN